VAQAPDITGVSGNTPIFGFSDTPVMGTITGFLGNEPFRIAGLITGAGVSGGSEPYQYAMSYTQPSGSGGQSYAAGYNAGLLLPVGFPYPPGYMISDGVTPGGVFPTGNVTGAQNIKIQPTVSGVNRQKFVTIMKFTVTCGATAGSFNCALGTVDSSTVPNSSFPLWPYIGLAHDLTPLANETMLANEVRSFVIFRLDILDNAFMSGNAIIPTWPNWKMNPNQTNLLWPGILPVFNNTGSVPLSVSNVFAIGFAC